MATSVQPNAPARAAHRAARAHRSPAPAIRRREARAGHRSRRVVASSPSGPLTSASAGSQSRTDESSVGVLPCRKIGGIRDQRVERLAERQRRGEVAADQRDAARRPAAGSPRASASASADRSMPTTCVEAALGGQAQGDAAGPGAHVGHAAAADASQDQLDQSFGLRARNERAAVSPEREVAEAGPAGHMGERLPGRAASNRGKECRGPLGRHRLVGIQRRPSRPATFESSAQSRSASRRASPMPAPRASPRRRRAGRAA